MGWLAWNEVKVETLIKSCKKCGTSNLMDGIEDNILWDTDGKASNEAETSVKNT